MRSILKLILGNSLVLLVLLLLVEIVLRLFGYSPYNTVERPDIVVNPGGKYFQKDSLLGYTHLAGQYEVTLSKEYDFTTTHDSNTLRITSNSLDTNDIKKPEIWILGCSFTHGWSINDDETFAWRLQSKLDDYKIINWGVSGYGTIHFLLRLEEALKTRRKPSLVIVNHADFHFKRNIFSFGRRLNVSRWNKLGRLNQPYAELTETGELLIKHSENEYNPWGLSRVSAATFFFQRAFEAFLDLKIYSESKLITELILNRIASLCEQNQVQLLLTNIGSDKEFIEEYSQNNEMSFVDIGVDISLKEYNNLPFDGHPSAKANEIYADKLHESLLEILPEANKIDLSKMPAD